ncbi:MAG: tetratricopeptide repeat protein [Verrucomicrobiaceae bacterium]|nr:tetratricopeptide repeat protein [Verrucomicrobiaceae bacterium]
MLPGKSTTCSPKHGSGSASRWWSSGWVRCLIVIAGLVVLYSPACQSGFTWDDDEHLTQNPCIIGPQSIVDIWTTRAARICPLVLSTFWLEHQMWGLSPMPYHLVNVLMHAGAALLLWRVLLALRVPGAWLGAVLWAVHPVQVETVAWVTEMKNTQSGLFFMTAVLFYLRTLRGGSRKRLDYSLSLLFGFLGMASKTSVVVLPAVLGLCAWYVEGRVNRQRLAELVPYVLMALAASALALWTQDLEGANDPLWQRSLPERLVTAGAVVWFYLGKLAWPHPLVFVYPKWQVDAASVLWWLPLIGLLMLLGTLIRRRGILFAMLYFLIALGPVMGLLDHYFLRYSFVGDHFQYLASIGPLALLGAVCSTLPRWVPAMVLAAFGFISWTQQRLYRDPEVLWTHTLQHHPTCWLACNNLGILRYQAGKVDEAVKLWETALTSDPRSARTLTNLGYTLQQKGHLQEALSHYEKAIESDASFAGARYNYGTALLANGRIQEGLTQLEKAAEISSRNPNIHLNLGNARLLSKDPAGAIQALEQAMQLAPQEVAPLNNLAWLLSTLPDESLRDGKKAVELMTKAMELSPRPSVQTYRTLAAAQAAAGDFNSAIKTATQGLSLAREKGDAGMLNALQSELAAYREDVPVRYAP